MTGVPGTLYGVGLGPGDPELVTVKAARIIAAVDVVAYHSARHGQSIARAIAQPYLRDDQIEEQLVYPVTTETTDHPGGYEGAIAQFYEDASARLTAHLDAGRDVALLAEGDPLFYSSYMHMHKRIDGRYSTVIVPGVTSVSAASAALGTPLVEGDDVLTVLPGTLPQDELAERLATPGAAAIMKIGRSFGGVQQALKEAGRLEQARYVERASASAQVTRPAGDVDPAAVPYMSLVIVPGTEAAATGSTVAGSTVAGSTVAGSTVAGSTVAGSTVAGSTVAGSTVAGSTVAGSTVAGSTVAPDATSARGPGRVDVVGLGPAGRDWLTPQAMAALAAADDIVGYGPYVERVPVNPRQRRHASDNQVEAERAEFALDLAARGRRVAVVSSGDPGVFAMAAAVLEVAADDDRFAAVPIDVVPGLTAAQAVASQAGAPLGHDYAVLSLSDRLKPWDVVAARLDAAAAADFALAIYNPASRSRRHQLVAAREILLRHRAPETPVVVGRAVGTIDQQITVTSLGELDVEQVDMRCLLIIGSSRSRVVDAGAGRPRVITPRTYPSAAD